MSSTSYQVLARKYRPQSFDDVAGQGAVVQTLKRALETSRVAHAFLFTGSRGVGKTTLARILARCLVCEQGVGANPCGVCGLCKGVAAGSLTDVVEIDGASNNTVEQVRDLQEVARYLPQLARFKIFIIDEVHMLSTSAFNALLKILEEPPPHVKFIFATTEPHKIPVTILSRCQRYDFKRLPQKTIVERLVTVLAREQLQMARPSLEVIARAADGGMRDALSLTDQVLSFAGENASVDQITEALGIIDARSITLAVEAAITGDAKGALAVVDNAHQRGHDVRQLLTGIASELRHLSVANAVGSVKGLADLTEEDSARIDARARALDGKDLLRLLAMALDAMDPLARSDDPRLHVELVLLRMCRRPPLADALAVSEAIVRLEALAQGRPVPPLPPGGPAAPPPGGPRPLDVARAAFGPAPSAAAAAGAGPVVSATGVAATAADPAPSAGQRDASPSAPSAAPAAAPVTATSPPTEAQLPLDEVEDPPVVADSPPPAAAAAVANEDVSFDEERDADPAAGLPLTGVDPRFLDFVDRTARKARPLGMHLDQARVASIVPAGNGGGVVVNVFFGRELHERALSDATQHPVIVEALAAAFGTGTRLAVISAPADTAGSAPSIAEARERAIAESQAALEAHARAHPVVEKAVALFGGQVRAVRRKGA